MARRMILYAAGLVLLVVFSIAVYAHFHPAQGVLVLEYHHIADRVDDPEGELVERYYVPTEDFAAQLD